MSSLLCLNFLFSWSTLCSCNTTVLTGGAGSGNAFDTLCYCNTDGGRVAEMPLTAAEQRTRRRAGAHTVKRAARRANSFVDSDSDEGARSPVASPGGGACGSRSDSGGIDSDSDDGADDSDSDGADDAFAAEASDDARSPAASPGGSRSDSDNSNDGPGAALADSASHELSDGDAAACSAVYGSAVLPACTAAAARRWRACIYRSRSRT